MGRRRRASAEPCRTSATVGRSVSRSDSERTRRRRFALIAISDRRSSVDVCAAIAAAVGFGALVAVAAAAAAVVAAGVLAVTVVVVVVAAAAVEPH